LVERGILTPKEREILLDAEIPATQRHNAVLVWLIRLFLEGRQTGVFDGGTGFEQQFMEKCHVIRGKRDLSFVPLEVAFQFTPTLT
jgi:hypothetical protein